MVSYVSEVPVSQGATIMAQHEIDPTRVYSTTQARSIALNILAPVHKFCSQVERFTHSPIALFFNLLTSRYCQHM